MGESFALPAQNDANNVLPQPTPSLVAEDDDEPPSSGPRNGRSSQITPPVGRDSPSIVVDIEVKEKDFVNNINHIENSGPSGVSNADLEKLDAVGVQRVRRRKLRVLKLSRTARLRALFTPRHDIGPRPTYLASLRAIVRYTPLNLLLLFIPVSWALHFTHQSPTLVFVFSALAIVPLAALLGLGTEQIALRTSQSVGGLLNASLGNLIEMIISGVALKQVSNTKPYVIIPSNHYHFSVNWKSFRVLYLVVFSATFFSSLDALL